MSYGKVRYQSRATKRIPRLFLKSKQSTMKKPIDKLKSRRRQGLTDTTSSINVESSEAANPSKATKPSAEDAKTANPEVRFSNS
jgi:hypothetical protein